MSEERRGRPSARSDDIEAITQVLNDVRDRLAALSNPEATHSAEPRSIKLERVAAIFLKINDLQKMAFGPQCAHMFGDPSFYILLDLYVQDRLGNGVSVTSASTASHAPLTTAARHIAELERLGMVRREEDHFDRRRTFLHLTADGELRVQRFLTRMTAELPS